MYSLLTGRPGADYRDEAALAEKPVTADAHHRAMRHLFVEASVRLAAGQPWDVEAAAVLVAAAHAHAKAAETAPATLSDPIGEALKTAPPASRTTPRDGDTLR